MSHAKTSSLERELLLATCVLFLVEDGFDAFSELIRGTINTAAAQEMVRKRKKLAELGSEDVLSLDDPIEGHEESTLLDFLQSENDTPVDLYLLQQEQKALIPILLTALKDQEKKVIALLYGLESRPLNTKEIGVLFGVGEGRIRQIAAAARAKMLHKLHVMGYTPEMLLLAS